MRVLICSALFATVTSHESTAKRVYACDNIFLVNAMGVPIRSAFTCRHIQLQKYCQKGMVCACDNIFLVHAMGVPICSAFICCHNQLQKYCEKGMRMRKFNNSELPLSFNYFKVRM